MASFAVDINEPVSQFFRLNFPNTFALSSAGVIKPDFDSGRLMEEGGKRMKLRYWGQDTDAPEQYPPSSSFTFKTATSASELAYVTRKARPRTMDKSDVDALGQNGTPLDNFAAQTVEYWAYNTQATIWSALKGIFDPSAGVLLSTHVNKIGVTSGVPVPASRAHVARTKGKVGDQAPRLRFLIAHSSIVEDLEEEGRENKLPIDKSNFEGLQIIADDTCPTVGGTADNVLYASFILAPMAIGLGFQTAPTVDTQFQYWSDDGSYRMVQTVAFAPHLFGVSFTGTPADEKGGPTNTEFATAGNWTLRSGVNAKHILATCLISNRKKR